MKISRKTISLFELTIMLVSILSFAYLVSTNVPEILRHPQDSKIVEFLIRPMIPSVSASQYIPSGCCLETKSGAICQEMSLADSSSCKEDLVGTSCSTVSECQTGCCYDSSLGICSMNSPRQKCEVEGNNWSSNAQCNIAECQLGCCILGDSVSMTTNRECTLLSTLYNFDKKFQGLDSVGSCLAYTDLSDEGACLTPASDFSGKSDCLFTTKSNCASGDFKKGYLCTSEELNTSCEKTTETTCLENKDQIYFLDSCGNRGNIYDASKAEDQSYWEKIISKESSCKSQSASCGNCDYLTGSICNAYDKSKDEKPQYGDNVCRNLNCGERKHGESWCIYDMDPNDGIYPVGAGSFVATCVENQISVSSCGGFNQFICAENRDESYGFSEAKCLINDWRACINANDAESYSKVKEKCDQNPQCIMFNDLYGENKLKRSDNQFLAGFDPTKDNVDQGTVRNMGSDQNKLISHCVPRFTPGLQFWTTNSNPLENKGQTESNADYGGSAEETGAICSLGSFSCTSKTQRDCSLSGKGLKSDVLCASTGGISSLVGDPDCGNWYDLENWECNFDGTHTTIKGEDLPALLSAMNERCRSLGSCGVSSNWQGSINKDNSTGFTISRVKIDLSGKQNKISSDNYILTDDYLDSIKKSTSPLKSLEELKSLSRGLASESLDSAGTSGSPTKGVINLKDIVAGADVGQKDLADYQETMSLVSGGLSLIGLALAPSLSTFGIGAGISSAGTSVISGTNVAGVIPETWSTSLGANLGGFGATIGGAAVGAALGYAIGSLIVKKHPNWSPARGKQFIEAMTGVGAAIGATIVLIFSSSCSTGPWGCIVGLVIAALYALYESCIDSDYKENEYYVLEYSCGAWEPPKNGDCSVCNNDVRPCSEYRCKSLGSNCHYFNSNGEPGFCASMAEIWKASIKPWPEIISKEHKYSSVSEGSFKIEGQDKEEVPAWTPVTFGIITDKPAVCKVGINHSLSFDQIGTTMLSSIDTNIGRVDGLHHQITLSPSVTTKDYSDSLSSLTTLPIEEGENDYFIKCRNFAGQENEAPFVVRVLMSAGPDLTPPMIVSYDPKDNSYIKFGETNSTFSAFLNEPAECRYAMTYDYNSYSEMPNQMNCITSASAGFYGLWTCNAKLTNLTEINNQVFIKCLDQPDLVETELIKRIETPRSFVYNLQKCLTGLSVAITNPLEGKNFEGKDSVSFDLDAITTGCINGGEALCSFNIDGLSSSAISFLSTGKTLTHSQPITGLGEGNHTVFVSCIDEAGNTANASTNFTITYDNIAPKITRTYMDSEDLVFKTDEPSECVYKYFQTGEGNCDFGFEKARNRTSYVQTLPGAEKGTYYIKCRDAKLNEPLGCTEVIRVQ